MRYVTRPLPAVWPNGARTPVHERTSGRFQADLDATWKLLERELRHLEAGEPVVIEAGYEAREIRLDGRPRAGARPVDPGVIVSFESRLGPLRYACDTYWRWESNLRAIGLTLEHLRAVDRYGVTRRGEQYQGWSALPPAGAGEMSPEEAEAFIRHHGGGNGPLLDAYRAAAKRLHPDVGGSDEDFVRLERARQAAGL